MPAEPTRAHRILAAELARLRAAAGLSLRELGQRGAPPGKPAIAHARVKRIELTETYPTTAQAEHWLNVTDADHATRAKVRDLVEEVHAQHQSWATMLDDAPDQHLQAIAAAREEAATRVDVYCQQWLPGLVQTADYARALFVTLRGMGLGLDVEQSVCQRMRRQELLGDANHRFRFLVTHRAMTWNPAPESVSMTDQTGLLSAISGLPNAEVRVLDATARPVGGGSSFTVYDGVEAMVSMELEHRSLQVFDDADVDLYRQRFEEMWEAARPLPTYESETAE